MGFRPPLSAGGGSGSGLPTPTAVKTTTYTAAAGEFVRADASSGAFTVTLPAGTAGQLIGVKKVDTGSNAVAVVVTGGGTIDADAGGASITSPQFGGIFECVSAGVWLLVAVTSSGGSNGVNGSTWYTHASGSPSSGTGVDGDYSVRQSDGQVFKKVSGTWADQSFSIKGSAGTNGTNGTNGAISQLQEEGSDLTVRPKINFIGANVTAADDAANNRTNVTVSGGGAGITVQDENSNVATGVTQIDFQGAGVSAASGSGEVVVTIGGGGGGTVFQPARAHGYGAWAYDVTLVTAGNAVTAGVEQWTKVMVPETITIAKAHIFIWQFGTGGAMANCYVGVRDSAGVLLGKSTDQAANWGTANEKAVTLAVESGQSLTITGSSTAFVWVCTLIGTQATTPVQLGRTAMNNVVGANSNLAATAYRFATNGSALSALAATPAPSSNAAQNSIWAAIS